LTTTQTSAPAFYSDSDISIALYVRLNSSLFFCGTIQVFNVPHHDLLSQPYRTDAGVEGDGAPTSDLVTMATHDEFP
jgi:hypothetical protein